MMTIMKYLLRIVVFLQLLLSGYAWAQNETAPQPPSAPAQPPMEMTEPAQPPPIPSENYGASFMKMIIALVVIFVAVAIVIWLIKNFSRGRFARGAGPRRIEIIERRALSQKSVLYLLEVDGARVLVSESQNEVRTLYQGAIPEEKE